MVEISAALHPANLTERPFSDEIPYLDGACSGVFYPNRTLVYGNTPLGDRFSHLSSSSHGIHEEPVPLQMAYARLAHPFHETDF
ncbi:MAG: hypothetical protein ABF370_09010 [Verrucomicrobiales bacterium]